jgi:hypothetical protein
MARTTLEMFIKIVGANKVSKALDNVSDSAKRTHNQVEKNTKANAQFAAGMSGLSKAAITGAAAIAAKSLFDFSLSAIQAASSAQEAAGAFGTTFAGAAEKLNEQLKENANLFGLTTAEAQQLVGVFGAVAQGIGFTQDESADLSARIFELSGDIASFNNITAGAEPVLQAFRSAIVGERESLKTYGIAIGEAEVQTKAFEMTGKTSTDQLTRQDKALATVELAFQQASVQIGNAKREEEGFAAQSLIARSATQELREELGEQLLPAAGEILRTFNEIRNEATPALIDRFSDLNLQVIGTVALFNELRDALSFNNDEQGKLGKFLDKGITRFNIFGKVLAAFGIKQQAQILIDKKLKESTQELVQEFDNYAENTDIINNELNKFRLNANILIPLNKKFGTSIEKDVLPFAEKLAGILGISNKEIKELTDLQKDRDEAQTDLNRALEEEGLLTAQEALRKKELQQQIAELTFFQRQGKDVTEELAVAQEELKLVELALQRESDQLVEARKRAIEAQQDLDEATGKGTSAIETQIEAANNLQGVMDFFNTENFRDELILAADTLNFNWKEALDGALNEYLKFRQQVTGKSITTEVDEFLKGLDEQGLLVGGFKPSPLANPVDTPANTLGDQSSVSQGAAGGTGGTTNVEVYIGDEKIEDVVQKVNTRLQTQGKTFAIR